MVLLLLYHYFIISSLLLLLLGLLNSQVTWVTAWDEDCHLLIQAAELEIEPTSPPFRPPLLGESAWMSNKKARKSPCPLQVFQARSCGGDCAGTCVVKEGFMQPLCFQMSHFTLKCWKWNLTIADWFILFPCVMTATKQEHFYFSLRLQDHAVIASGSQML